MRVGLDDLLTIPDLTDRSHILTSHDFMASLPPYDDSKDYLGPLLRAGYRLSIAAKMGVGKTSLLMEMGAAVAKGEEFLGFKGAGVSVLYVNLEMGPEQIGDAVMSARLPHQNFHLWNAPDGLAIDDTTERGENDRRLLLEASSEHQVVILDPWYQLLVAELPDSGVVGAVIRWLRYLQERCPHTCFVLGKHVQENVERVSTGAISGFKSFDRNADIILGLDRIEGNVSKLRFLKNRSPRLNVKMNECWTIEWERGVGFTRIDDHGE